MRNGHLNLLGQRFGHLTVIEELPYRINKFGKRDYMWLCQCDCGNTIVECTHNLRQKCATRCKKCYMDERRKNFILDGDTAPKTQTLLYNIWTSIKQRCYNPNDDGYCYYGARGIKMCDEWKNDFKAFHDWSLKNGYKEETNHSIECSIDRIDSNGNYEPDNCRWATAKQQMRNRRNTLFCIYRGERIPLIEAAEKLNVKWHQIYFKWRHNKDIDVSTLDFSNCNTQEYMEE